jgi:N-acetyl-gamma-glutamylphosphate reductase
LIDWAASSDPTVKELLSRHPRIGSVKDGSNPGIDFAQGAWTRAVRIDDFSVEVRGLTELMDNNPMVCADTVSVPSAAGTLALVAFGPLIEAGLLVEAPTFIVSANYPGETVERWLESAAWQGGLTYHVEPQQIGDVIAVTGMAAIRTPDELDEIDALYEERFGRSFFVRRDEDMVWAASLVENQPYLKYRLRITPDDPYSLLSISLLADKRGKAGPASLVHAMNVMAGFEESLGIAD